MTPQEARLWLRLKALRPDGLHFRRQVPLGRAIVDFACIKLGLVIEIDGGQHGDAAHARRDRERDRAVASLGFKVLRFWNAEVDRELDGVVETILAAARSTLRAVPHPYPSPEGREREHDSR